MACRAVSSHRVGMCFACERLSGVPHARWSRSAQPKLPSSPGSPAGDAFRDRGPKVVESLLGTGLNNNKVAANKTAGWRFGILPAAKTKSGLKMPKTGDTPYPPLLVGDN